MSAHAKRFRVAVSFAGEKREFVSEVAGILAKRFREDAILYDKYHVAEFARSDLAFLLPDLYHDETELIVVVICAEYDKKAWCGLEWNATFDLLKRGNVKEVMLCRFDHATVKGLYDLAGYVELDGETPETAARRILERLALNEGKSKTYYLESSSANSASSVDFRGAPSRLSSPSDLLIGRERELAMLDAAWSGPAKKNVVTIVAWGGVGKTSLVARWAADTLAKDDHGGVVRSFDWSFYSQGVLTEGDPTGSDKAASADLFVKAALEFFGEGDLAASAAGAWVKGERLARRVGEERTLLILDGLEPLQDAKTGELRDPALRALLGGLAAHNRGLCVITTRQTLPELNTWHKTMAPEWKLDRLSKEAGARLLADLGIHGTREEIEQLAADVKGHALTLTLMGKYLAEAHGGDIRRRDRVSLAEADDEETNGHAAHVIEAYERWLEEGGRHAELAILRLLGPFDRPATPDCLAALREQPAIAGLTDALIPLTEARWNVAVQRLVKLGLIEEQPWEPRRVVGYSEEEAKLAKSGVPLGEPQAFDSHAPVTGRSSLDAHPLVREYFARRLRETDGDGWREAHSRLFDYLRRNVPHWPEGLDGLQPLYQAVAHGCQAGRFEDARAEVYRDRILRGTSGPYAAYSTQLLGAVGADLGAIGAFFVIPWRQLPSELTEFAQAWLLNEAAYSLRALGRLTEAREPMQSGLHLRVRQEAWKNAAVSASNLSELDLTLGDVASAVREGEQSVLFADRSEDVHRRIMLRTTHGDALHQAGDIGSARALFEEAEGLQRERLPDPYLYSLQGFRYCDFLISAPERTAWQAALRNRLGTLPAGRTPAESERDPEPLLAEALWDVERRATAALVISERNHWLLDLALDHLTLGRVLLYREAIEPAPGRQKADSGCAEHLDAAVHHLRSAGDLDHLPRALLTRAWLRALQGRPAEAHADLDEAEQIAERGPMPLHLADVYLHRARLFFRDDRAAARDDLAKARALIFKHGYLRRKEELEDAERVIL